MVSSGNSTWTETARCLSRDEVSSMLTMLNEGVPPNEVDMEWVIQSADEIGDGEGIETPEVLQLISAWYIRPSLQTVEEEDPKDLKDAAAACSSAFSDLFLSANLTCMLRRGRIRRAQLRRGGLMPLHEGHQLRGMPSRPCLETARH